MPNQLAPVDEVFRALSDATRRAVVAKLCHGPAAVTTLAHGVDMALPSFLQHLKVLEATGLVVSTKSGRVRTYRLQPQTLKHAEDWMTTQRKIWEQRLDQLDLHLLAMKESEQ